MQPSDTEVASSAENAEPNAQLDYQATASKPQEKPHAQPASSAAEHAQPQPAGSAGTASTTQEAEPPQASTAAAQPPTGPLSSSAEAVAEPLPGKGTEAAASAAVGQDAPSKQQHEQEVGPFGGPYGGTVPLLLDTAEFNTDAGCIAQHSLTDLSNTESVDFLDTSEDESEETKPSFVAPLPLDEAGRNATEAILPSQDEPEDPVLHSLCELVTRLLRVPMCGVSLINAECQRFCAMAGLERFTMPRDVSLCSWALQASEPEVLVIENMEADARYSESPFVTGAPFLKFYAGAPLVASNGYRLGSLCVVDMKPRTLSAEEFNVLSNFAELAVRQLEKDHLLQLQRLANRSLLRTLDVFQESVLLLDTAQPEWRVLYANEAWTQTTETPVQQLVDAPFWQLFSPVEDTLEAARDSIRKPAQGHARKMLLVQQAQGGRQLLLRFIPAATGNIMQPGSFPGAPSLDVGVPTNAIPDGTSATTLFFASIVHDGVQEAKVLDTWQSDTSLATTTTTALSTATSTGSKIAAGRPLLSFEEISVGILIRATPSGRFFRGTWNRQPVTVKVMERYLHECVEAPGSQVLVPEEALICCSTSHPTLVRSYGFAARMLQGVPATNGQPWSETWLVLEAFDQGTLANRMMQGILRAQDKALDVPAVVATARDIAGALAHLHSQSHVHGHLTADSVWLSHASNGRGFVAKLADFGVHNDPNTLPLTMIAQAPPEMMLRGVVSEAGDVYSLGVVMWEMVHKQRIGRRQALAAILSRLKRRRPVKCTADMPELYVGLTNLCLSIDPEQRPAAKALQRALHRFARQEFSRHSPTKVSTSGRAPVLLNLGQDDAQKPAQQKPPVTPAALLDTSRSQAASQRPGTGQQLDTGRLSQFDHEGDAPVKHRRWFCCFMA